MERQLAKDEYSFVPNVLFYKKERKKEKKKKKKTDKNTSQY